jgi:hypothetical protein
MKKQTIYYGIAAVIIIIIIIAAFFILTNEKGKFIGTWQYSASGTITFNNDNTAIIDNIGLLGLTEFIGSVNYEVGNNQVTFTSGSVSVSLDYNFYDSNTLVLTNYAGDSITLTKV